MGPKHVNSQTRTAQLVALNIAPYLFMVFVIYGVRGREKLERNSSFRTHMWSRLWAACRRFASKTMVSACRLSAFLMNL